MRMIAVGPGDPGVEWTETIMKAWQSRPWSWDLDGLSLHSYTVVKWPPKYASTGFGLPEYAQILKSTLEMEDQVKKHSDMMDKYDPQKKVALVVGEWGAWYGSRGGVCKRLHSKGPRPGSGHGRPEALGRADAAQ